jgi:hypothetical protein
MARAISISGRPLKGAGNIVTSPNGTGGSTRNVIRRAPMTVSTEISVRLNAPLLFKFHHSRLGTSGRVTAVFFAPFIAAASRFGMTKITSAAGQW